MIRYRRAALDDIGGIDRVVRAAYNALARKHGFAEIPPGPVGPLYADAIAAEGEGCWVAEENGGILGAALASLRPPVWFLGYLFVDPATQTRGMGRELLARVMDYGGRDGAVHSLITLAFNPVSIGLYLRHGMAPLQPLYVLEAPAAALRQRLADRPPIAGEKLAGDGAATALAAIDWAIMEGDRTDLHRYLLHVPGNACHLFRVDGEPRGYAYVSAGGRVGPLAAAAPLAFDAVLESGLVEAARTSAGDVSLLLAGSNIAAMTAAAALDLRITMPLLLMASRPFGDFDRYGFHSAGMM
jgi:GNAT superfamily N-acetyltransferase